MAKRRDRAFLGFSVHTGWAAMIAVGGTARTPVILERLRIEMMEGNDPDLPRFVYHAAQKVSLDAGERLVREARDISRTAAKAALQAAVARLAERNYDVVASGIIGANRPLAADLASIVKSHALIHSAEGALFREAIQNASERLKIPVTVTRARDLESRGGEMLGVGGADLGGRLTAIGRAAGKPWSKDQRDAFLAALLASPAP
jgi:hypothetical protein